MGRDRIRIEGMSCKHCVNSVKGALEALTGISGVQVDLQEGEASFQREASVSMEVVRRAVEDAGYRCPT